MLEGRPLLHVRPLFNLLQIWTNWVDGVAWATYDSHRPMHVHISHADHNQYFQVHKILSIFWVKEEAPELERKGHNEFYG